MLRPDSEYKDYEGKFFRVAISADRLFQDGNNSFEPYFEGIVCFKQCLFDNTDGYKSISLEVLKTISFDKSKSRFSSQEPIEFGDYLSGLSSRQIQFIEMIDRNSPIYDDISKLHDDFKSYHENAPWFATGSFYSEVNTESIFSPPFYTEVLDTKTIPLQNVHSLEEAENRLLETDPDYYMGCRIYQDCRSGNMMFLPVPCMEYGEGNYETHAARRNYCKELAEERGITLGPKSHDYDDRVQASEPKDNILENMLSNDFIKPGCYYVNHEPGSDWVDQYYIKRYGQTFEIDHTVIDGDTVKANYELSGDVTNAVYRATMEYPTDASDITIVGRSYSGDVEDVSNMLSIILSKDTERFDDGEKALAHIGKCCDIGKEHQKSSDESR